MAVIAVSYFPISPLGGAGGLEYFLESLDELLGVCHREAEWREETEHVGAGTTGEDMLLKEQLGTDLLVWDIEFDANHEATTTYINDVTATCSLDLLELRDEIITYLSCILNKVLLLDDVQYSKSCGTCLMVTAEGSTQLTIDRLELRRDEYTTHWETIADTLGYSDDVWLDSEVLVCEELTRTTITALDFVADEDGIVLIANLAQALEEVSLDHTDAAYTLDALEDDSTDIVLLNLLAPCVEIIERHIGDMTIGIDRCDDLWIGSCLDSKGGTSVEGLLSTEHTGTTIVEGCKFEGVLVGLSTTVDEEELIILVARCLAETLCQLDLQWVLDRIAIETQLVELLGHLLYIVWMAMSDGDHCVSAIEVKILLTFIVPYLAALAALDGDIK